MSVGFFLCDIQEKFRSFIPNYPRIVQVAKRMLKSSEIFNIPVICTEQEPLKFGSFAHELNLFSSSNNHSYQNTRIFLHSKSQFSMLIPPVSHILQKYSIHHIVLFGIESHICVLQSILDFVKLDLKVSVLVDGISSRHALDTQVALQRLATLQNNVVLTTSEAFLFELLKDSNHSSFRPILKIIKDTPVYSI